MARARRCGVVATLGEDQQRILVVEVAGQVGDRLLDCTRCAGGGCRVDELARQPVEVHVHDWVGLHGVLHDDARLPQVIPVHQRVHQQEAVAGPGASAQHDHGVRRTGDPVVERVPGDPVGHEASRPILRCPHDDAEADAEYVVVSPLVAAVQLPAEAADDPQGCRRDQRDELSGSGQPARSTASAPHEGGPASRGWRSRPPPSGREAAPG